jgi:hypothetical protein
MLCDDIIDVINNNPTLLTKQLRSPNAGKDTTETFGMTIEWLICDIAQIPCSISSARINADLCKDASLRTSLEVAMSTMPKIARHVGDANESVDFVFVDGQTLSVKSNLDRARKVCPQNIGQITKQKFLKYFNNSGYDVPANEAMYASIKHMILYNPSYFIKEYLTNTFTCSFMLWIYKKNRAFHSTVIAKSNVKSVDLENSDFSFTKTADWNESSTVKYKKHSIGEFQVHNNRNGVKFRFNMDKLLPFIADGY